MISAGERARNLFSVLDQDGDGVLTMEEFIEGIYMEAQNIRYRTEWYQKKLR